MSTRHFDHVPELYLLKTNANVNRLPVAVLTRIQKWQIRSCLNVKCELNCIHAGWFHQKQSKTIKINCGQ